MEPLYYGQEIADNYAEIPTRYESSLWDSDGGYNASHVDKLASLKLALGNQKRDVTHTGATRSLCMNGMARFLGKRSVVVSGI